jgi:hypothetical protein
MEKYRDYEEDEIQEAEKKIETSDIDSEVPKNFKPEADTIKAMQDSQKSGDSSEWGRTELMDVPVLEVDLRESEKILQYTPEDLKLPEYQEIRKQLYTLNDVIMPAVNEGKGAEYFKELDKSEGRTEFVLGSYEDVYEKFYGSEQRNGIRLDKFDGEFEYRVERGHKYLCVADDSGIAKVPARVSKHKHR